MVSSGAELRIVLFTQSSFSSAECKYFFTGKCIILLKHHLSAMQHADDRTSTNGPTPDITAHVITHQCGHHIVWLAKFFMKHPTRCVIGCRRYIGAHVPN
jgi:hypothetical protein